MYREIKAHSSMSGNITLYNYKTAISQFVVAKAIAIRSYYNTANSKVTHMHTYVVHIVYVVWKWNGISLEYCWNTAVISVEYAGRKSIPFHSIPLPVEFQRNVAFLFTYTVYRTGDGRYTGTRVSFRG